MRILRSAKQRLKRAINPSMGLESLEKTFEELKMLAAAPLVKEVRSNRTYESIREAEFKVFSQFGDDGIIQHVLANVDITPDCHRFIEFGVENYKESNTRFLLLNDNWSGLVIDGSESNINFIRNGSIYWKHDLTAIHAFVSRENINEIIAANDFDRNIGLLSIDIDGNDYWLWESISSANPTVVIIEYNSVFSNKRAVTIPYDPAFNCTRAHSSNLYWGCSLKALWLLGKRKGYEFIGADSHGNNAYFVAHNKMGNLKPVTVEEGFVSSKFRESRDENGKLTYVSGQNRLLTIADMKVHDVETGQLISVSELLD